MIKLHVDFNFDLQVKVYTSCQTINGTWELTVRDQSGKDCPVKYVVSVHSNRIVSALFNGAKKIGSWSSYPQRYCFQWWDDKNTVNSPAHGGAFIWKAGFKGFPTVYNMPIFVQYRHVIYHWKALELSFWNLKKGERLYWRCAFIGEFTVPECLDNAWFVIYSFQTELYCLIITEWHMDPQMHQTTYLKDIPVKYLVLDF